MVSKSLLSVIVIFRLVLVSASFDTSEGAPQVQRSGQVDGERISNASDEPGNWLSYGRAYDEQRFSPLDQINDANVDRIGLAWSFDTGQR